MTTIMPSTPATVFIKDQVLKDHGAGKDTTNFTVFASYAELGARLTRKIFTRGINCLAFSHPLLRTAFKVHGAEVIQLLLKDYEVPIRYYSESGDPEEWRSIVKTDLSQRFSNDRKPAWRASLSRGEGRGTIFLTFHHAVADGEGGAAAMNQLFGFLAQLLERKWPKPMQLNLNLSKIDTLLPPVETAGINKEIIPRPENYEACCTDFIRLVFDADLTERIEDCSMGSQGKLTVHSLLYAAYLKAIVEVTKPPFHMFSASSIVSFRKELNAEEWMCPLFTWLIIQADSTLRFMELAEKIKADLHGRLEKGEHKKNAATTLERLKQNPKGKRLLAESKVGQNVVILSNIGKLNFTGDYGSLKMTAIDAAGGCSPYFDHSFISGGKNMSLAVRTFQGRLRFVLNFPTLKSNKNNSGDEYKNILIVMERILNENCMRLPKL